MKCLSSKAWTCCSFAALQGGALAQGVQRLHVLLEIVDEALLLEASELRFQVLELDLVVQINLIKVKCTQESQELLAWVHDGVLLSLLFIRC